MVAVLDGISITWTPNNGPVVSAPSPYPGTPERLDNLLVHPIAPGQDTGITHYPGRDAEDVTWQDTIITFPADSGVAPLYLVFAKPMVNPLEVGQALDLMSRSRKDGLDIDHIPAQKALELALKRRIADLGDEEIQHFLRRAASIAIPTRADTSCVLTINRSTVDFNTCAELARLARSLKKDASWTTRNLPMCPLHALASQGYGM